MATATEVAERLRGDIAQRAFQLARWIVDRQAIAFSHGAGTSLPLFQFDFAHGCVRTGVAPVILELSGLMTDYELACWFVQPNGWLNGAAPALTLLSDVPALVDAARADRFVAKG